MVRAIALLAVAVCVLWPGQAHAFDCAKASTKTEKLICADSKLKQADDDLGRAWAKTRELISADDFKSLLANQRAWLRERDQRCGYGTDGERIECLMRMTLQRHGIVSATAAAGPGPDAKLIPFALQQEGSKTAYGISVAGIRFADPQRPGEQVFNEAMDALIADAPFNEKIDSEMPVLLTYNQSISLTYASPNLVSALVNTDRYDGGAHPNYFFSAINISPDAGELSTDMLFPSSAKVDLAQTCENELFSKGTDEALSAAERKERLNPDYEKVIATAADTLSVWTFHADGARIHFSPYELSSYAAGAFECRLPLKVLRGLSMSHEFLPQ